MEYLKTLDKQLGALLALDPNMTLRAARILIGIACEGDTDLCSLSDNHHVSMARLMADIASLEKSCVLPDGDLPLIERYADPSLPRRYRVRITTAGRNMIESL